MPVRARNTCIHVQACKFFYTPWLVHKGHSRIPSGASDGKNDKPAGCCRRAPSKRSRLRAFTRACGTELTQKDPEGYGDAAAAAARPGPARVRSPPVSGLRAPLQAVLAPGVLQAVRAVRLLRPDNGQHDRGEILGHRGAPGGGGSGALRRRVDGNHVPGECIVFFYFLKELDCVIFQDAIL